MRSRRVLEVTGGHPYATQELCYFLWEETPIGGEATRAELDEAVTRVLRSEHAHFSLVWEKAATAQRLVLQALAREPGRPLTDGLPPPPRSPWRFDGPAGAGGARQGRARRA